LWSGSFGVLGRNCFLRPGPPFLPPPPPAALNTTLIQKSVKNLHSRLSHTLISRLLNVNIKMIKLLNLPELYNWLLLSHSPYPMRRHDCQGTNLSGMKTIDDLCSSKSSRERFTMSPFCMSTKKSNVTLTLSWKYFF